MSRTTIDIDAPTPIGDQEPAEKERSISGEDCLATPGGGPCPEENPSGSTKAGMGFTPDACPGGSVRQGYDLCYP